MSRRGDANTVSFGENPVVRGLSNLNGRRYIDTFFYGKYYGIRSCSQRVVIGDGDQGIISCHRVMPPECIWLCMRGMGRGVIDQKSDAIHNAIRVMSRRGDANTVSGKEYRGIKWLCYFSYRWCVDNGLYHNADRIFRVSSRIIICYHLDHMLSLRRVGPGIGIWFSSH